MSDTITTEEFVNEHDPIGIIFGTYTIDNYVFQINSIICKLHNNIFIHSLNTKSWSRIDLKESYSQEDLSTMIKDHIYDVIDFILAAKQHECYIFGYTRIGFWNKYLDLSEDISNCLAKEAYRLNYTDDEYSDTYTRFTMNTDLPNNVPGRINVNCYINDKFIADNK